MSASRVDKEMMEVLTKRKRGVPESVNVDRLTTLIYEGADVNRPFQQAQTIKSVVARPALLGTLIKHGANIASPKTFVDGKNVLMLAIEDGNLKAVEEILKYGRVNLEAKTGDGETAALLAANKGNVDLMSALVKAGAKLYKKDREKNGVLHYAASSRSEKMIEYLLSMGMNPNAQNMSGKIPLLSAVDKYAETMHADDLKVLRLLAKVSDFQIKDRSGRDVFTIVMDELDEETAKDVKMNIMDVFKGEIEGRMKNLMLLSKRQGMEIPDDILVKISTMGLDDKLTEDHIRRKYSARSKVL